jgi:hypothetical protein
MANLHQAFLDFNDSIRLDSSHQDSLRTSRNAVRDKIRKFFAAKDLDIAPKFHGQGSFMMNTIIEPLSKEFDIDDGVYFISDNDPDYNVQTYHNWIVAAVTGHTKEAPIDKNTCVRVTYKASYHIDLPIYHVKSDGVPRLAHKAQGWIESDPREFTSWFSSRCDDSGQLRRLVRYLKAWSDFKKGELPSGLIMSILAAQNYASHARDDVSLQLTLTAIQETLQQSFQCMRPTTPANEDLLANFSKTKREYFLSSLNSLVNAATYSINDAVSHTDACRRWQVYFGADRFPFEDEEIIEERFTVCINPDYQFEIDCLVTQKGFMDKLLSAILRDNSWLMPERKLKFFIKTAPSISSYDVYWKIRNVGREAIRRKQVRGQIHRDGGGRYRIEHTSFRGKHYVECYIVQHNICVAKAAMLVPIMNTRS